VKFNLAPVIDQLQSNENVRYDINPIEFKMEFPWNDTESCILSSSQSSILKQLASSAQSSWMEYKSWFLNVFCFGSSICSFYMLAKKLLSRMFEQHMHFDNHNQHRNPTHKEAWMLHLIRQECKKYLVEQIRWMSIPVHSFYTQNFLTQTRFSIK